MIILFLYAWPGFLWTQQKFQIISNQKYGCWSNNYGHISRISRIFLFAFSSSILCSAISSHQIGKSLSTTLLAIAQADVCFGKFDQFGGSFVYSHHTRMLQQICIPPLNLTHLLSTVMTSSCGCPNEKPADMSLLTLLYHIWGCTFFMLPFIAHCHSFAEAGMLSGLCFRRVWQSLCRVRRGKHWRFC